MKMCVSVFVNDKYICYLPYFSLFLAQAYPEYVQMVFVQQELSPAIRELMKPICKIADIRIVSDAMKGLPTSGQGLKTIRWIFGEKEFGDFSHVYIGDVDLLICKEQPSLYDAHILHCEQNNLCYSNCLRPGQQRLSGLHFIRASDYWAKTESVRSAVRNGLVNNTIVFGNDLRNEHILYQITQQARMGLPKEEHRIDYNGSGPHHGIHLGIWRAKDLAPAVIDHLKNDNYLSHFLFFKKIAETDLYKRLNRQMPLVQITKMVASLGKIFKER